MNGTALVIVLASAFLHAGWNYLLKKSDRKIVITRLTITPGILIGERGWLKMEWRRHPFSIIAVGFLSIFTYLMILFALQMSKVSYVAAVREVSIALSAYFGIAHLGEKHGRQKLLGAVLITVGVIAIGLSR